MLQMLNAARRSVNAKLITLFDNGAGTLGGEANPEYTMLYRDGAITTALDDGFMQMQTDFMDTGFTGSPFVVAGGNMHRWLQKQNIACCNLNGFNVAELGQVNAYYDNQLASVLGPSVDNPFFAFAPGAAIFVGTDKYIGQFRQVSDKFVMDTIVDPVTGMTYDFKMTFDECEEVWKMRISKNFGLWQLPKTLFKVSDSREGVNWNVSARALKEVAA
jgi:hypothetical protein